MFSVKIFSVLEDLLLLFYPKRCVTCASQLLKNEKLICTFCWHDLPYMYLSNSKKNKVIAIFYGKVPIENAISYLYFRKNGKVQKLIHELKYRGNQEVGSVFGHLFGNYLKSKGLLNNIDFVVPVPIHSEKLKTRGYNQLTLMGIEIAKILQCDYVPEKLIKISKNKTQTFYKRLERFKNVENIFLLEDVNFFYNKHVLVIDDVVTTGATLVSCCKELLKTKKITISIATLAFSE